MATVEDLTIVIWSLVRHMTASQVLAACDDLDRRPVGERVAPLTRVLREEAVPPPRTFPD